MSVTRQVLTKVSFWRVHWRTWRACAKMMLSLHCWTLWEHPVDVNEFYGMVCLGLQLSWLESGLRWRRHCSSSSAEISQWVYVWHGKHRSWSRWQHVCEFVCWIEGWVKSMTRRHLKLSFLLLVWASRIVNWSAKADLKVERDVNLCRCYWASTSMGLPARSFPNLTLAL